LIGNNVWIGDSVLVLAGVTIGDGAVIGAGAVVTQDIPKFGVAVGVPARIKRFRFPEPICDQLKDIAWWDWPEDRIKRNKKFFEIDLSALGEADELLIHLVD